MQNNVDVHFVAVQKFFHKYIQPVGQGGFGIARNIFLDVVISIDEFVFIFYFDYIGATGAKSRLNDQGKVKISGYLL